MAFTPAALWLPSGSDLWPLHTICPAKWAGWRWARERRYAWLERVRVRNGARLTFTAHHADDQVETVLMRALEGSGPAGLAGMAPFRGYLVRPLLSVRRRELVD